MGIISSRFRVVETTLPDCKCISAKFPQASFERAIAFGHLECLSAIIKRYGQVSPNAYEITMMQPNFDMFMTLHKVFQIEITFRTFLDTVIHMRLDMFRYSFECIREKTTRDDIIAGTLLRCSSPFHKGFVEYLMGKGVFTAMDIIELIQHVTRCADIAYMYREGAATARWTFRLQHSQVDKNRDVLLGCLGVVLRRNLAFHYAVSNWRKRRCRRRIAAAIVIQRAFRHFSYSPGGVGAIRCHTEWKSRLL